jgi:hypothetical protein
MANFALSADGQSAAVESVPGIVRLVDLREGRVGEELAQLEPPAREGAFWPSFSPDGSRLAVIGADVAGVWDLRQLRAELAELGLDWDCPPYPPARPCPAGPLLVKEVTALTDR